MKKSLLGLAVAYAAFFCGVWGFEFFRLKNEPLLVHGVEKIETVEILPFRVGQLQEAEGIEVVENNEENFSGWYQLDGYEGMSEVNMISLGNDYENDEITSYAGVFTSLEKYGDQGFVEFKWAKIKDGKAEFETKKIKNIKYRFKGNFFNNKTTGEAGEKVLRGTLQKFVKGKKVAEASGDFAYYEPHCWH